MQLKYKRWIKDPWIFFSFFAVFVAIGLIIVPQIRLMFSSIKEERGIFFLKLQIPELQKQFQKELKDLK
jgi:hypothetical protein